jgi:hypothetical protein
MQEICDAASIPEARSQHVLLKGWRKMEFMANDSLESALVHGDLVGSLLHRFEHKYEDDHDDAAPTKDFEDVQE